MDRSVSPLLQSRRALLLGMPMLALAGCNSESTAARSLPEMVLAPVDGMKTASGWQYPGIDTGTFIGRPTLINFWATWCGVCDSEHASLQKLAADTRIRFVGVAVRDTPDAVRSHLKEHGNPYAAVSVDARGALFAKMGQRGVPTKVLIDGQRRPVATIVGPANNLHIMLRIKDAIAKTLV
jgi:cytochrome c biogenesis protein CcmG/thiol:disulfide interchange protein DsbE